MVRIKKAAIFKAAKAQIAAHGGAVKSGGQQQNAGQSKNAARAARKAERKENNERRQKKLAKRKNQRPQHAPSMWDTPAPANLVARLDQPKVKSKYLSYFEFAENTEKKDKKLEFQVTNDPSPPPGFTFIPFGDPDMTKYCKELSRERGAMIFIVSGSKEDRDKINVHMHRTGYHFRESIVEEARESLGDAVLNHPTYAPGTVEPVPETQDEINKQADAAIKDLFPRIPNTDRQMILDHAFRKGGLFHGEPKVGLTPDLPLSRRVQLAVLAHIRHTHTRYDKLLRETTWANARKAVEPVCLDVLIKWRGDEETGRDQMDEILREVVIITDSEDEVDSSSEDSSSDEEGEISSASTEVEEIPYVPTLRNQHRASTRETGELMGMQTSAGQTPNASCSGPPEDTISSRTRSRLKPKAQAVKKAQRHGFKRYQAAYDDAMHRRQESSTKFAALPTAPYYNQNVHQYQSSSAPSLHQEPYAPSNEFSGSSEYSLDLRRREDRLVAQREPYYSQHRQHHHPGTVQPRNEITVRPQPDHHIDQGMQPHHGTPSNLYKDERPPQVVRGSLQRHSLQDMLAISIENSSNDAVRSLNEEGRNGYENILHRQDSHPQEVLDARRRSPAERQVVVIDDHSPQNKRRRVHEDDSGSFRPLPSRDYSSLAAPADFHMLQSSSGQPRYPSAGRSMIPTEIQNSTRSAGTSYPTARAGIPIYDAPEAGYIGRPPEQFRRSEVYDPSQSNSGTVTHRSSPARLSTTYASEPVYHRSTHQDRTELSSLRRGEDPGSRHVAPEYPSYTRRLQSPSFPVSSSVSRSYDVGPSRGVVDQGFIQNFSQSRLNGSVYTGEGSAAPSVRSRQLPLANMQGPPRGYQDHGARFSSNLPQRSRSPPRYVESPIYEREGRDQPLVYEGQHRPVQYHTSANEPPIFIREKNTRPVAQYPLPSYPTRREQSRHPVIVLD